MLKYDAFIVEMCVDTGDVGRKNRTLRFWWYLSLWPSLQDEFFVTSVTLDLGNPLHVYFAMLLQIHSIGSPVNIPQVNALSIPPFHVEQPPAKRARRWKSAAKECEKREKRKIRKKRHTGCDGRVSLPRSRTTRNVHHTSHFLPLLIGRHCANFQSGLRKENRLTTHTNRLFSIQKAAAARLAKQIEKIKWEAPSSFMHCI